MLNAKERLIVIALVHLGITLRQRLNDITDELDKVLEPQAKYPQWASEAIYNSGDDAEQAADQAIEAAEKDSA